MSGPLAGVRVVDFGQFIAGPLTAMLLAEQGAEVIHVDPPGGPRWQTVANELLHRDKTSIELDLDIEDDLSLAHELISRSDVVIENFRPGVMDRRGLGYDALRVAHPGLVYCGLPGFGEGDTRAGLRAWEEVLMAAAAVTTAPGRRPRLTDVPIPSVYGALYAAPAIIAALDVRDRDGAGQRIEVPLFDATLGAHGFKLAKIHGAPVLPNPDEPQPGVHAWMGEWTTKDRQHVFFHTGTSGSKKLVESLGFDVTAGVSQDRVAAEFRTRTADEWERLAAQAGAEIVRFRTMGEWLDDPAAAGSGLVSRIDHPTLGALLVPGRQVTISRTESTPSRQVTGGATARQQVEQILAEPRRQHERTGPAEPARAALAGIRVLEVSHLVAGPVCGRTLSEYGAEVTKIENPRARRPPAAWASSYEVMDIDLNRGKRRIELDLTTEHGQHVVHELLRRADVLVHNFRPDALERMGLGSETVRRLNPTIVYAHITSYGRVGPRSLLPGHEHAAQAMTGMAVQHGTEHGPAMQAVRTPVDSATGMLSAFGVMVALHAGLAADGCDVDVSLAGTGALLQLPVRQSATRRDGTRLAAPVEHQGWRRPGSSGDMYRTADGWMVVAAAPDQTAAALGVGSSSHHLADGATDRLSEIIAAEPTAHWIDVLGPHGLDCHRVLDLPALMEDPELRTRGRIITREHQGVGMVDHLAPIPRLSRSPLLLGAPRTPPGTETSSILSELTSADVTTAQEG